MRAWGGREVTHSFQEASEQGLNQRTKRLAALRAQSRSHIGTETPVRLGDKSRGGVTQESKIISDVGNGLDRASQRSEGFGMDEPPEILPHPKSGHCSTSAQRPCDLPMKLVPELGLTDST